MMNYFSLTPLLDMVNESKVDPTSEISNRFPTRNLKFINRSGKPVVNFDIILRFIDDINKTKNNPRKMTEVISKIRDAHRKVGIEVSEEQIKSVIK